MKGRKRKKKTDKVIIFLIFILMISIGTIAFFRSNIFNLSEVEIIGNKNLKKDEVVNLEMSKNIFTYKLNDIKNEIITNPYIEDAKVKRKLPNKILITIDEVKIAALLSNGRDYCYIDDNGDLIKKVANIEENSDKIVFITKYDLENGKTINFKSEKNKNCILKLISLLKEEHLEKEITKIEYTTDSKINVLTKVGSEFLLLNDDNLNYNIARASKILLDLQNKNIKSGIVDLTYSNYAVYKPS